ncbi:MAG: hypothetical protein WCF67_23980, partial [Chitinophagaceae bacterium]
TVSTPFIYVGDKMVKTEAEQKTADTDENNLIAGTTEEKSESGANTISEYLNEIQHESRPFNLVIKIFKCHTSDIYLAFHPELICPPPKHNI